MANIKNVVKVMNFHSLLRVDKSKKRAESFFSTEKELDLVISRIIYNKNLNLDKKVLKPNNNGDVLNIYIGNDFGFCGNFNSVLNSNLKSDKNSKKIVIGKKLISDVDNLILFIDKEEFINRFAEIEEIINNSLEKNECKEINVIYNHYNNINDLEFRKKTIFPIIFDEEEGNEFNEDFVIEADINTIIIKLISVYLCYQIKILEQNSLAAENVMRQRTTTESIKKISSLEEEKEIYDRKIRKYKSFQKQLSVSKNVEKEE